MNAVRNPLVFISYRRVDSSAASRWLAQTIARTFGTQSVFIDTESIRMGDAWPDRIDAALTSATVLVPVIGPSWLRIADDVGRRRLDKEDDWVRNEIRHALEAKQNSPSFLFCYRPRHRRSEKLCLNVWGIYLAFKPMSFVMIGGKAISRCFSQGWMISDLNASRLKLSAIQRPE